MVLSWLLKISMEKASLNLKGYLVMAGLCITRETLEAEG